MTRDELVRRLALGGVILSTAVLSYSILRERAEHIGFPFWASFLYPVGLDALILGASRTWQDAQLSRSTRRLAMWMTLAAIVAGIAAFVAEFRDLGWEAVGFAVLIPATLAAALVLTSRAAADRRANVASAERDRDERGDDTTRAYAPRTVTFDAPPAATVASAYLTDVEDGVLYRYDVTNERHVDDFAPSGDEPLRELDQAADDRPSASRETVDVETRRAWVREQLLSGKNVTGADVDRRFGGTRNGARLVRSVRERFAAERGGRR